MTKLEREKHVLSLLEHDREIARDSFRVAGIDEAGRGPLIGPVVAACVIMPLNAVPILWVDDSKKLSEKRREMVYEEIVSSAVAVGVGSASREEIDAINILEATKLAMKRAAEQVEADLFLIDAVRDVGLKGMELPIVHGDAISYSIAAASIVAKVTRDRQMAEMDKIYPGYGLSKNKGYGTKEHIEALKSLGPCEEHRRTFIGHFVNL
ncbi:MAG: ribonuclease HII [Clostridia bacterium]|nr:ribonuclease HII [Clostridia bacterium]